MAITKNQEAKSLIVSEIKDRFERAKGVVLVDYRGLTVEQVTELRSMSRKAGVEYKVLKNTLVQRAVDEMGLSGMEAYLKGPTAFAFSYDDEVAAAKLITEFVKKMKTAPLSVKAGIVDGTVINAQGVQALSDLPPKEVLIAKMLGSMNAPITGFVSVLGGTIRKLLYALNAVKDQKEA